MEVSPIKAIPLDFSLNVKTESISEKGSQSAFKVVTPKHADGKSIDLNSAFFVCFRADNFPASKFLQIFANFIIIAKQMSTINSHNKRYTQFIKPDNDHNYQYSKIIAVKMMN